MLILKRASKSRYAGRLGKNRGGFFTLECKTGCWMLRTHFNLLRKMTTISPLSDSIAPRLMTRAQTAAYCGCSVASAP